MDETSPLSSPLSDLPSPTKISPGTSHIQATPTSFLELNAEAGSDRLQTAKNSAPKKPPSSVSVKSKDTISERSPKHPREEDEDDKIGLPAPKRLAIEKRIKTQPTRQASRAKSDSPDGLITDGDEDDFQEIVVPKKSEKQPKPRPKKAANKPIRPRACAECKRRKVNCKHTRVERNGRDETDSVMSVGLSELTGEPAIRSALIEAEDGIVPAVSQIPVSYRSAANAENNSNSTGSGSSKANKKKAAPKIARAPPERSSTRSRKAPERLEDVQEQQVSRACPSKKQSSKVFDPVYITTNSTSRLGKADIYHMLTNDDTAWTSLSSEQQAILVSMLPDTAETQQLLARIRAGETEDTRPQYLKASNTFRTEVAKFQTDLTNGHLAKTWQTAAGQAVTERAAGEYDAWKAAEAELWWGQKSK